MSGWQQKVKKWHYAPMLPYGDALNVQLNGSVQVKQRLVISQSSPKTNRKIN